VTVISIEVYCGGHKKNVYYRGNIQKITIDLKTIKDLKKNLNMK